MIHNCIFNVGWVIFVKVKSETFIYPLLPSQASVNLGAVRIWWVSNLRQGGSPRYARTTSLASVSFFNVFFLFFYKNCQWSNQSFNLYLLLILIHNSIVLTPYHARSCVFYVRNRSSRWAASVCPAFCQRFSDFPVSDLILCVPIHRQLGLKLKCLVKVSSASPSDGRTSRQVYWPFSFLLLFLGWVFF